MINFFSFFSFYEYIFYVSFYHSAVHYLVAVAVGVAEEEYYNFE
jgi:hypothetical protein